MKKLLTLALAVAMLCALSLTVGAADLTEAHPFGAAPEGWVDVDDTEFSMITYYNYDGSILDAAALMAQGEGAHLMSWQYFGGGHLRNSSGFNTNNELGAVEFTFNGTGVAWITQFRHMADQAVGVYVYIDGEKYEDLPANPSANFDGDHIAPTLMWQVTGLDDGEHVLRIENAMPGFITIDSFSYQPGAGYEEDTLAPEVTLAPDDGEVEPEETEAKEDDKQEDDKQEDDKKETEAKEEDKKDNETTGTTEEPKKGGCGSAMGAAALILAAALVAPVAIIRKKD